MAASNLAWSLGLKNHASGKYLTQETFGFALNVNGKIFLTKQEEKKKKEKKGKGKEQLMQTYC